MEPLLFTLAQWLVRFVQRLPLAWVARLGRLAGALAYQLDRRHRRVALRNLTMCFGTEKTPAEIRALARENFRRIGENFACAIRTVTMTIDELRPHVEFVGHSRIILAPSAEKPPRVIAAIGHFGNFELYARFHHFMPHYTCATTYRALRQLSLNRLLQDLRERTGCQFFERRFDAGPLKTFMNQRDVMLGLLADQSAGSHGLRLPFFGHDCSTSAAPAIFALRYDCALCAGICYRVGLARWRIEGSEEIPTHVNGRPRPVEAIMRDVNRIFEVAVRRDPANWFWVHNRWKESKTQTLKARFSEPQSPTPLSDPPLDPR